MSIKSYLRVLAVEKGQKYASFYLYLPAGSVLQPESEYYTEYRFTYEEDPIDVTLKFSQGPNNPANRSFYRINQAFVVKKEGNSFSPVFRALQRGEIGFALREEGAGDFVGGYHGDEILTQVSLSADGRDISLEKPCFCPFEVLRFYEQSYIYRCNTPQQKLILHTQEYSVDGSFLCLNQEIKWLADAMPLKNAFMPMLTAQRVNPDDRSDILTDTVELYAPDGKLAAAFDTSSYEEEEDGTLTLGRGTYATAARVYGKKSGFSAEAGYTVLDNTIPMEQIETSLCVRYMPRALDNKIYFSVGAGIRPKAGTVWKSNIYYHISYNGGERMMPK